LVCRRLAPVKIPRRMIVRVSAFASLFLGCYAVLGVLTPWGVGVGLVAGAFAVLLSLAALSEHPEGWTRRAARIGLVAGGLGLFGALVWALLAVLGV
jgi:hypothetical protein